MSEEKALALWLADVLEVCSREKGVFGAISGAAELRRLHAANAELLEALKRAEFGMSSHYWGWKSAASDDFKRGIYATVCAAIAKAEGV
jgi:hypothetical protein